MLVRILNMRGVDLNRFDFDYDLTWAALFMDPEGRTFARYGGRDADSPDHHLTLPGLKHAMRKALTAPRPAEEAPAALAKAPQTVEQYPAARRLKPNACIHCHQVYDFRREDQIANGAWSRDKIWVYPSPRTLGLVLDADQGDRVSQVLANSAAAQAGLQSGDVLHKVDHRPVASFADVQYALHRAGQVRSLPVEWTRGEQAHSSTLALPENWRVSDISWRASMWGLEPSPCVHGQDLTAEDKQKLGLDPKRLAFRQGKFVPAPSRRAGIQEGDVILGIDDKPLEMTMLQFNAHIRLNYRTSDRIVFNVLRGGKRLDLPMVLPAKASF